MRLFTAVDFSDRIKDLINKKVKIIKDDIAQDIKWVKKENWHITLKFLGDVDREKLPEIKTVLSNNVANKKFYFQIDRVGAFPHSDHPRVIYFGIDNGRKKLINIYNQIEKGLTDIGFTEDERSYNSHLTIGRVRKNINYNKLSSQLANFIAEKHFINIYSIADKISLIKSELRSDGPIYKEIFSKKLK